jgi:hypothetical protein
LSAVNSGWNWFERGPPMPLTRDFKKLVRKRVASDPVFGKALLLEGVDTMLSGDVDTGKAILCDYIKATVGFERKRPAQAMNEMMQKDS